MVTLDGGGTASTPLASEIEIVSALATDMLFAYVVLSKVLASGHMSGWLLTHETKGEAETCTQHISHTRPVRWDFTHAESFGAVASLAAALPLTSQVVDC